jgi:hypothetical protein
MRKLTKYEYKAILHAIDILESNCEESNPEYQKGIRNDLKILERMIVKHNQQTAQPESETRKEGK